MRSDVAFTYTSIREKFLFTWIRKALFDPGKEMRLIASGKVCYGNWNHRSNSALVNWYRSWYGSDWIACHFLLWILYGIRFIFIKTPSGGNRGPIVKSDVAFHIHL